MATENVVSQPPLTDAQRRQYAGDALLTLGVATTSERVNFAAITDPEGNTITLVSVRSS